jgi:hypothetical protein
MNYLQSDRDWDDDMIEEHIREHPDEILVVRIKNVETILYQPPKK